MIHSKAKIASAILTVASVAAVRPATADYTQYDTDSVEWLVDNSDVIAVVNYENDPERQRDVKPEILQEIKGESKTLRWPLVPLQRKRNEIGFGPSHQYVHLVFVKAPDALLQEVPLTREMQSFSGPVPLQAMVYGVSQTGELALSQSELLHAIKNRMGTTPGERVSVFATPLTQHGMWTPKWFPLNTSDEYFVVKVPWDTHYRDAIIRLATSGNAAQRMYAAFVLSHFDDAAAKKTLEDLSEVKEVTVTFAPLINYNAPDGTDPVVRARDVRDAAERALKAMTDRKASGTRKLDK